MIRNGTNSLGRPYRPRSSTSETIPFADSPDSPSILPPKISPKSGGPSPPHNCRLQMGRYPLPLPPPPPSPPSLSTPPHRIHMIDTDDTTSLNNILDAIEDLPDESSEGSVFEEEEGVDGKEEEEDRLTPLRSPKDRLQACRLNLQNMAEVCKKQGARNVQDGSLATPPCSPLHSPMLPTAPASIAGDTHYISSVRASSRRTGGSLGSPEKERDRDPLTRLLRFLRAFYRELAARDPVYPPPWAPPLPPGTTCAAHFEPALLLAPLSTSSRTETEPRDYIGIDQIFSAVRTTDGMVYEAPRRVLIEGSAGSGKTTLALRVLHSWATHDHDSNPIQLALFVPLRELRGGSLSHYLGKFQTFISCRLLITCCPGWNAELAPFVQRRLLLQGLDWKHVQRLVYSFFSSNKEPGLADTFLEQVTSSPAVLRPLCGWPLGWLLLCVLFDETGCRLPSESLDLHQSLFKCLIRRSLIKRGDALNSPLNGAAPDLPGHCKKLLAEFGKLALTCVKEDRFSYTDSEIRAHCRGGGLEVTELGFLMRGLNFGRTHAQKKRPDHYTPLHRSLAEFLAAYYLSSVVHYSNILRRELEDLPGLAAGCVKPSSVLVLRFLLGLLGKKGHLVFGQLSPLDLPTRTLFSLLQAAGPSELNVAAVCRLVGAAGGSAGGATGQPPPHMGAEGGQGLVPPLVHTAPLELEGWASVLRSDACTLEALELVFQFDKGEDCEPLLDSFFAALSANDSVRTVRISSLLGHEFTAAEVERLAVYVKTTLPKARLHTFELVITCLEDSVHDRFQCLVDALSEGLTHAASANLSKLVLDLNLSTAQVAQLCGALRCAPQVNVLHLPHLGCGRDGLKAIAGLLTCRPLVALNLSGSWGMRREDPPSSTGSGSMSSSGQYSTVKQAAQQQVSPKTNSYYFSSLPRGALGAYNSLTRPATLPRQPLQNYVLDGYSTTTDSKRNSDSVLFQRLFHPLPSCDAALHSSSGFHDVFEAIRDPSCKLRSLNVSKCLLGAEDALCLGETMRRSGCLDALRLEGATRLGEVLPVLLGLADNSSLQLLDLGSQRLVLDDGPTQLVCQALIKNTSLRLLSLEGWTFRIEEEGSLPVFLAFLQATSVRDLVLANCRLHVAIHDGRLGGHGRITAGSRGGHGDSIAQLLAYLPADFQSQTVVFLRLGGFQVTVNDRLALRGPLLLPFLRGFTHLSDLDLSLDKNSTHSNPLLIDDKTLVAFFQTLCMHFRSLQSLKISYWRISLEECERTLRTIGRCLKTCSLSYLKLNGLVVTDTIHKASLEHFLLQTCVANLNYLSWLSIVGVPLTPGQASGFGKCVRERFPGTVLQLSAKDVGTEALKNMVNVLEEGGKIAVLFIGGPSCNLRIHRLLKNQKLRGKFKRFTSLKE
ncbi:uncharacterized protein LOC111057093 [Nilaparvata lugens]|uniref:uncharacterized protein LOC111057093 n=1 Tax=Nilaparvata lugens TaxID=108931 RepID=UPI00193E2A20|nr:uncharacterized protein LOC111057093 [Nilaparvata lugens]